MFWVCFLVGGLALVAGFAAGLVVGIVTAKDEECDCDDDGINW